MGLAPLLCFLLFISSISPLTPPAFIVAQLYRSPPPYHPFLPCGSSGSLDGLYALTDASNDTIQKHVR